MSRLEKCVLIKGLCPHFIRLYFREGVGEGEGEGEGEGGIGGGGGGGFHWYFLCSYNLL